MPDTASTDLLGMTSDLVCAYLNHNNLPAEKLGTLISATYNVLAMLGSGSKPTASPEAIGAVTVRKSLASPDHIISMIDGKPYRALKRHLGKHEMTPDEYRARYKLPADYPMVALSYSAARRAIAMHTGLGRKPDTQAPPAPPRPTLKIAVPKAE